MTDKEFVLSVYPGARPLRYRNGWIIYTTLGISSKCRIQKEAWASAAKRIREQQKEQGNG